MNTTSRIPNIDWERSCSHQLARLILGRGWQLRLPESFPAFKLQSLVEAAGGYLRAPSKNTNIFYKEPPTLSIWLNGELYPLFLIRSK